jgi:type IV pilus assembly protein PilC
MPLYRYQAQNAEQQPVAGEILAASVSQAVSELEARGLSVQAISLPRDVVPTPNEPGSPFASAGPTALQVHLRRVIERGREIVPALRAYSSEVNSRNRRRQLEAVIAVLEHGDPADAANRLDMLPGYWIPLLTAATSSRDPGRVLREFLRESRRVEDLQRQWWLTLAYPLLVIVITLGVLVAFSVLVIPIFREIFNGFGLKLPNFTIIVLSVAEFISSGRAILALLLVLVGVFLLRSAVRALPGGVKQWFADRVGIPLGRSTALARFTQFTAELLEADLETWQALRLAGMATESRRLRHAAWQLANHIESNGPGPTRSQRQLLSATFIHAIHDDLPAKGRVRLLRELSETHSHRAGTRLSWTRGIIEPIAVCLIGLAVGCVVLALFLPLISLIQGLS